MKTDLEKFIELYKSFGIDLKAHKIDDHQEIIMGSSEYYPKLISSSDKFDGYFGFYSDVYFDLNGKFIKQGFYE